jgi:hypothetical protein
VNPHCVSGGYGHTRGRSHRTMQTRMGCCSEDVFTWERHVRAMFSVSFFSHLAGSFVMGVISFHAIIKCNRMRDLNTSLCKFSNKIINKSFNIFLTLKCYKVKINIFSSYVYISILSTLL